MAQAQNAYNMNGPGQVVSPAVMPQQPGGLAPTAPTAAPQQQGAKPSQNQPMAQHQAQSAATAAPPGAQMSQAMTTPPPPTASTPGGLLGNISNNRYQSSNQGGAGGMSSSMFRRTGGGSAQAPTYGGEHQSNFGPVDTGVDAFRRYEDASFNNAMRHLQPQIDAQQNKIAQSLVDRGLQPGTEAYAAEMDRMTRSMNDAMSSAAFGAQQAGLAAQNQAFGQGMANNQFGLAQNNQNFQHQATYDQMANALNQSQIAANASMFGASAAANASTNNARLANQLGMHQLNENARQFDISDIYRTQGQDQNFVLGLLGANNQSQAQALNQFNAQQGANQNWINNAGSWISNAPGVIFNPNQSYTSDQIGANANHMNAIGADNQMMMNMMGGAMSFMSDRRAKKNIAYVGEVFGVKMHRFEYKDPAHGAGVYVGVMADEVEKDYPDAIHKIGELKGVDYSKLPVKMVEITA